MSNIREIFGAHESVSGHRESDAEDHESDDRLSGSHDMFGSSDRLFVGDLGGELAMLVGGDFHDNFTLHGGDLHASSISGAPRRVGAGLNTRAGDELPERSAACSEGVGAAHAGSPMAATAPHVRRSAFLAATAQMAPAAGPRRNLESQKGAVSTARASDRPESAVFSSSGSDDEDNDGWDGRTSSQARGASGSATPGLRQNRRPQKDAAHTARASERRARSAFLNASRNRRIGNAKRRAVAASVLKLVEKRAAEQPARAVASQRAAQARASDDAPPLVVGPATKTRPTAMERAVEGKRRKFPTYLRHTYLPSPSLALRFFRISPSHVFLPPALNQGEGAARLRAAPARARRGRLSINTPMCRQTALHLG